MQRDSGERWTVQRKQWLQWCIKYNFVQVCQEHAKELWKALTCVTHYKKENIHSHSPNIEFNIDNQMVLLSEDRALLGHEVQWMSSWVIIVLQWSIWGCGTSRKVGLSS